MLPAGVNRQAVSKGTFAGRVFSQQPRVLPELLGTSPAPYRDLSGPSVPKCRKSLENVSWGFWPRNPEKSPKGLGNNLGSLRRVSGKRRKSLVGLFPRNFLEKFRGSGARGPRRHFRDFHGLSGPKGPRDLCKGQAGWEQCMLLLPLLLAARQRSGEGLMRRNGCPKECFWRVRFFSAP